MDDEALPEYLDTPEMRQAMETLRQFAERERAHHIYQKRLEYMYQQRETARELKSLRAGMADLGEQLKRERREKERERREKERLLALLKEKGIALE